jgi:nucleoside-diphosphate-sugar epimerase
VRTALVTGSAGFIGRHLVAALHDAGYEVTGVDVAADDDPQDVRDCFRVPSAADSYKSLMYDYDVVVHAAAVVGGRRVMDWTPVRHAENLELDAAVFSWCARVKPGRLVYVSSACAYPVNSYNPGNLPHRRLNEAIISVKYPQLPDQLYGWAKLTGEVLAVTLAAEGVPVTVVRPFSVYGEGMNPGFAVRGFLEQVRRRDDPVQVWGTADQTRDYIHVTDVADAVVALAAANVNGPVNLGTGVPTSLTELIGLMAGAAGYSPDIAIQATMPSGVPYLVADNTRLLEYYKPQVSLADWIGEQLNDR